MNVKPLTEIEKFAIQAMVDEGLEIVEIKEKLDRGKSSKVVENYLLGIKPSGVDSKVYKETINKLKAAGIPPGRGRNLLDRVLRKMTKENPSAKELFNAAISSIGAAELIKNRTDSGAEGVAIMTPEASALPVSKPARRKNENHIFKPRGDEV